jgi:transcriptional regulator with XRE-family HTH domain
MSKAADPPALKQPLSRSNGWTQEKFAERAAIQQSYLDGLERGTRNPSVRTLVRVANAFGISVSDLFQERRTSKGD